jgi:hypothetical protein
MPRPSRRVRALLFLTSVAAVPAVSVLAALVIVPWWAVGAPSGLVIGSFWWLRRAVRATAAARRAQSSVLRHAAPPYAASAAHPARAGSSVNRGPESRANAEKRAPLAARRSGEPKVASASRSGLDQEVVVEEERSRLDDGSALLTPAARRDELFDIEATSEPLTPPPPAPHPVAIRYALVDEDDIPLTWDPVPVPRPTYTMKSHVMPPQSVPNDVAPEATLSPEAGAPAYQLQPERRVAGI